MKSYQRMAILIRNNIQQFAKGCVFNEPLNDSTGRRFANAEPVYIDTPETIR